MRLHQLIYYIEEYKFEVCLIYILLLVVAAGVPLGHRLVSTRATAHMASADITYPRDIAPNYSQLATVSSSQSMWPMHGMVTTEFGVYHEPFQQWHTGIDISSGKPSGTTQVAAFRPGTVVQVVHSNLSYGNHVVIDHGNGLTSLYGHLYSTEVTVGQIVQTGQIIGYEGDTGDSTGPHLHFELDQNNKPVNPHNYLPGMP